ncbi:MAG: tetratricopeptide repeat protein [Sandaracinaceae bacterium]|nr:tetratricopeptide repeat protein [Sandaracinaceae bacterium]MDW8245088.1 tetratricopeptide repeat protein [Sandaracinaceae bacterium]
MTPRFGPLLTLLCASCASAPRPAPPRLVKLEETRIVATRQPSGEYRFEFVNPQSLFDEGNHHLREGRCDDAVQFYDRLVREFPSSKLVSPALYNGALCLLRAQRFEQASQRFDRLLALRPNSTDEKHARFLWAEALAALGRWEQALENAQALLSREDLSPEERLEAMARKAEALLGQRELDSAQQSARQALAYFRVLERENPIHDDEFAAMSAFVFAETLRLRSEAISLPLAPVEVQHEHLERRAALLLQAQAAYFDTIRFGHPRWSPAAGHRIGAMYRHFFDALMNAPVPPPPSPLQGEPLRIYEQEFKVRLEERILPLLRHAIRYWELTMLMAERIGANNEWLEALRSDLESTRALLAEVSEAIAQRNISSTKPNNPSTHPQR